MTDVFISYKSEERARAESLAAGLTAAGYRVWWDDALTGGDDFPAQIDQHLRAAHAVIVIWSAASNASKYVHGEAHFAFEEGKLICALEPTIAVKEVRAVYQQLQMTPTSDVAGLIRGLDKLNTPKSLAAERAQAERVEAERAQAERSPRAAQAEGPPTLIVDPFSVRDFTSIQAAVDAATDGARILVKPGRYEENVRIDKNLELIGDGPAEQVVLHADAGYSLRLAPARAVRVEGLTISRGVGEDQPVAVAVFSGRASLHRCVVASDGGAAFYALGAASIPRVTECAFRGPAFNQVVLRSHAKCAFADCTFSGAAEIALVLDDQAEAEIRNCRFQDLESSGVHIQGRSVGRILGCSVQGSRHIGVSVVGATAELKECEIVASIGKALLTKDQSTLKVEDCAFSSDEEMAVALGATKAELREVRVLRAKANGLVIMDGGEALIEGGSIREAGGGGGGGLTVFGESVATVRNLAVSGCAGAGALVGKKATLRAVDCAFTGNSASGVHVQESSRAALERSKSTGNGHYGLRLAGADCVADLVDCDFTQNKGGPWLLEGGKKSLWGRPSHPNFTERGVKTD